MRDEAERQGVKLSDEKALEIIQQIRATLANEMPDNLPQQPTEQPPNERKPNK